MLETLLYLHAVLPTLEDLLKHSPEAKETLGDRKLTIRITVSGCSEVYLKFENRQVHSLSKPEQPDICLHFPSPQQFIGLLKEKRPHFPHVAFPKRPCPQHLLILPVLLQCIEKQLLPPKDVNSLMLHLRLLIGIAFRAVPFLANHELETKSLLQETPVGLLQFKVIHTDISGWIDWNGKTLTALTSHNPPPQLPDAIITFNDPWTAYHTFHETLDTQAAIGLHQLRIEGHLPLAEKMSMLLERISLYLPN